LPVSGLHANGYHAGQKIEKILYTRAELNWRHTTGTFVKLKGICSEIQSCSKF